MQIMKTVTINKPVARVWQIIGENYEDAGLWSSAIYASVAVNGSVISGAPVAGRVCETTLGPFTEQIVEYDAETMALAYRANGDKMPGFVRKLQGSWKLAEKDSETTVVVMRLSADIAQPFKFLMGWIMKRQFNTAISVSLEDLKYYAENGTRHPRKIDFDKSQKAARAREALAA